MGVVMADKSEDKDSLSLGCLCIGIFFTMGVVQLWLMVSAVSDWIGSTVLALIISVFGTCIPIPWFLIGHWYFEGTLPWGYIVAWVVGWGAMFFTVLIKK